MKIRTQNLFTLAPLLFVASLALGLLNYMISKDELLWGFNQQASSIAIAASSHLESRGLEKIIKEIKEYQTGKQTELMRSIQRVSSWNRAKGLWLVYEDDSKNQKVIDLFAAKEIVAGSNPSLEGFISLSWGLDTSAFNPSFISTPLKDPAKGDIMYAAVPLSFQNSQNISQLIVETNLADYTIALTDIVKQSFEFSIVCLLLGVFISLLLSRYLSGTLIALNTSLTTKESFEANTLIAEVNDLASTFGIIQTLISDNAKTQEALGKNKNKICLPEDLAEGFNTRFLQPKDYCLILGDKKFEISAGLSNYRTVNEFFDIIETQNSLVMSIGIISEVNSENSILEKSALLRNFQILLKNNSNLHAAMLENALFFKPLKWQIYEIDKTKVSNGNLLKHHIYDPQDGKIQTSEIKLNKTEPHLITANNEKSWRVELMIKELVGQNATQVREDLSRLIEMENLGANIILGAK